MNIYPKNLNALMRTFVIVQVLGGWVFSQDRNLANDSLGNATVTDTLELPGKITKGKSTQWHQSKEISRTKLSRAELKNIVAAQGDPMKAITTLPGASNQNDVSVRPFVRGGKAEETQVLWDGIPLLQPYHFGSLYSLFNVESIQDLTLYSGGFPAEVGNVLSGALFINSRPPSLDSLSASMEFSLLRGNAYLSTPIIKNKLGIAFAYQSFWYDWVFYRGLDLAGLIIQDDDFQKGKNQTQELLTLPNFKDWQLGLSWKINNSLYANYTGLISKDVFSVKDFAKHHFINNSEVSPKYYSWNLFYGKPTDLRETVVQADVLAGVGINNQIHELNGTWNPTMNWQVKTATAYQSQSWDVGFFDNPIWIDSIAPDDHFAGYKINGPTDYLLNLQNRTYDFKVDAKGYLNEKFQLNFGGSESIRESKFDIRIPRPIFEAIVNGNGDVLDALGEMYPNGFVVRRKDSTDFNNINYLDVIPKLIQMDQKGELSGNFYSAYGALEYNIDDAKRLTLGLRSELDSYAEQPFLSPRLAYFQSIGQHDEVSAATGLYSQSDFPFQVRNVNVSLQSEKAVHFNLEWLHGFSKQYRLELKGFQKNYFNLVVPYLITTGKIDWKQDALMYLNGSLDSTLFSKMDKKSQDSILNIYGDRKMQYRNGGTGKALGMELSFYYDPTKTWGGWISAEMGYSKRQDTVGGANYDFRYARPWAFNWINHFNFAKNYSLAIRGRFAAGLPYTDYAAFSWNGSTGDVGQGFTSEQYDVKNDTLFYSGVKNGRRYSPYSRWDIRVSKSYTAWGHPMETYFEMWNAFNTPNFLLSDSQTHVWKFADYNYPVPVLFLGVAGRW